MDWTYIFNTSSREGFGHLYLSLIEAFEQQFFLNPSQIPLFAMSGDHAKSYAADVMFHYVLDGKNPVDVIKGAEADKMYLEGYPTQAVEQDCFADGMMMYGEQHRPVSLLFRNEPDLGVPLNKCGGHNNFLIQDIAVVRALMKRFNEHTRKETGGIIFASTSTLGCSTVSMVTKIRKGEFWDRQHLIEINSPALRQSEKFQQGWRALIQNYG